MRAVNVCVWSALLMAPVVLTPGAVRAGEAPDSRSTDVADVMSDRLARETVASLASVIERLRGLGFEHEVPARVVDRAEAREHAVRRLETFYTEEHLEAIGSAYALLGLLPAGTDVVEEYLSVLEEQAGGYYDPAEKAFLLLENMPAGIAPVLVAHELTHALEDQHFDLDGRLRSAFPNDDLVFAHSAVHEGSATLLMTAYAARAVADGTLSLEALRSAGETEAARAMKLMAMPAVLRRPLLGAYLLGAAFLAAGSETEPAAGTYPRPAVDRAYRDGPVSSEQILHPQKYWDPSARDAPTPVSLGDAGRALGRRWKRIASGVLGELVIGVMVDAPTPSTMAGLMTAGATSWSNGASSGWDGDRWELWQRGDREVVLLLCVWDSARDAEEFAAALPARAEVAVRVEGNRVALVAGPAGKAGRAAMKSMLATSAASGSRGDR